MTADEDDAPIVTAILVTGPSGAGRSTAIKSLEDQGFEAIDNIPLALAPIVVDPCGQPETRRIAIGIDTRTRGFSVAAMTQTVADLRAIRSVKVIVLYLECEDATLLNRFQETRRRHPGAPGVSIEKGIAAERAVLASLSDTADMTIDTTQLTPHDLRAAISGRFGCGVGDLALIVQSFSYKRGAPASADMVFDCRFLRNPHWSAELRPLDGRDPKVANFVAADPIFEEFFERLAALVLMLLPAYKREGKSYLSIAMGCTGGRHRSVAVAERLAAVLNKAKWPAMLRHRDLKPCQSETPGGASGETKKEPDAA